MQTAKMRHLAGIGLVALATAASVTTAGAAPGDIWGATPSVIAPYWRQSLDCLANPASLVIRATAPTPPTIVSEPAFNYPGQNGSGAQNCASTHTYSTFTNYSIAGVSSVFIMAQFSHDPTLWGYINTAQTQYAPEVIYNASETPLTANDVAIYNLGGTETQATSHVVVVAPGVVPGPGQYGNPAQLYGPSSSFPSPSIRPPCFTIPFTRRSTIPPILPSRSPTDFICTIRARTAAAACISMPRPIARSSTDRSPTGTIRRSPR